MIKLRPVFAWMALIGVCVLGLTAYRWYSDYETRLLYPGLEAFQEERHSDAVKYLEPYLLHQQTNEALPYWALAWSYHSLKSTDKAVRLLEQTMVTFQGKEKDALRDYLAVLYLESNKCDKAIEQYRQMNTISEAEKNYIIGYAYGAAKRFKEAIPYLMKAIQANPGVSASDYTRNRPNVYLLLARNHFEDGDMSTAVQVINRAVADGYVMADDIINARLLPNSIKEQFSKK